MNLIANTGIQLINIPLEIDLNSNFKMFFHEWYNAAESQLTLEIAHHFSDNGVWVKKNDLQRLGYIENGKISHGWDDISDDFFANGKHIIGSEDSDNDNLDGCFQLGISKLNWAKFENKWLPLPFFHLKGKKSEFGPTNWCRFKLIPVETLGKIKKYSLLIAFDTTAAYDFDNINDDGFNETPVFENQYVKEKEYSLCNDEYKLNAFFAESTKCEWVNKLLLKHFHGIDDISKFVGSTPKLGYIAQYMYLVQYIKELETLPKVTLFSDNKVEFGNVDLVVDIGNSRTCAVLYDNGDFTKLSPLELQDYTTPVLNGILNKYKDSFDMRLAFREADFGGNFGIINSTQFTYTSFVRLGKEANNLIHKATNLNTGAEKVSTFSSPKRFLWDTCPQKQEWEYVTLPEEATKPIFIKGISEQIDKDGSYNKDGFGGTLTKYSRKALMTFSFMEILSQANTQINSFEQRKHWGNVSMPRKINRIIITCPTAMSKLEQTALRKCAEDAAIILEKFKNRHSSVQLNEQQLAANIRIIPSSKNKGSEWIFDEATAAQFVFLYAEIKERYLKNVEVYFDLYGKKRNDLEDYNKKSLTVGSVDIGAGTTDIMIASYKYDNTSAQCILKPVPLFWESFYIAGDDLMKELINTFVIRGQFSPIEQKILSLGKKPVNLINPFLGTDVGVSFENRQLRSQFNLQVSVPIVSYYLELLKLNDAESLTLSFEQVFNENKPTKKVLEHFKNHFGFELESLVWQYNRKNVSQLVEKVFDSLVGKISSFLSFYECDIVLLSGRPTSLKPLTNLFLKYYAIAPNRLKTMNDYRVGTWYPEDKRFKFVDGNGMFLNPKSIITTGAMIGEIASKGGLNGFALNLDELKAKFQPTTNYFGKLDGQLKYIETFITPEENTKTINVTSLPFRIGVRQYDVNAYPSRPFYMFNYDEFVIEDRAKGQVDDPENLNEVKNKVNALKDALKNSMPLQITIERDIAEDKENLKVNEILDKNGNSVKKGLIKLQIQSMSEEDNFWLDSGIFS